MPSLDEPGEVRPSAAAAKPMKVEFGPRARPLSPVPSAVAVKPSDVVPVVRREVGASSAPGASNEIVEAVGTVTLLTNYSGFGVAEMVCSDAQATELRLTGDLASRMLRGASYVVRGVPTVSRWGAELVLKGFRVELPAVDGRLPQFVDTFVSGLPYGASKKLVEHAKVEGVAALSALKQMLGQAPWALDWGVIGVSRSQAQIEADRERFLVHQLVGRCGLVDDVVASAVKFWGPSCNWGVEAIWAAWCRNPYELIGHGSQYDFAQAESFSGRFGSAGGDASQVRAVELVAHVMEVWSRVYGHVYLTPEQLRLALMRADTSLSEAEASRAIGYAVQAARIEVEAGGQSEVDAGARIYLSRYARAEARVAQLIVDMAHGQPLLAKHADMTAQIQDIASAMSWGGAGASQGLDPMQLHAVHEILTSPKRLHVLTGGPGSGKTAVLRVLVEMLGGKKIMLSALSGMVVKDLSSKVDGEHVRASTIHSLISALARKGGDGKLSADLLVVDEGTLPDLLTYERLMSGLKDTAHLLILADPDLQWQNHRFVGQLPSIGAGRVVADMVRCACVDRHRLMNPYRSRGAVLEVVEQVRRGVLDVRSRGNVAFKGDLPATARSFALLQKAYAEAVAKWGASEVVLLLGRRKGEPDVMGWNTVYANARLREAFNPKGEKVPCSGFRSGDRLVVTEPIDVFVDAEDGEKPVRLVNGEAGTVTGYVHWASNQVAGAKFLKIAMDDGRDVRVRNQDFGRLQFGWALTVHYTQGAQYKHVFVVVTPGGAEFVNSNMLLTAFSRARESLEVYGDRALISQIAQTPAPARNSGLVERVGALLQEPQQCDQDRVQVQIGRPGRPEYGG